jgi:ParB-like chromosome segregation protein Spo0J
MELRPIIVDSEGMILGGNMRFKALKELKYKDVPDNWVKCADELTDEEKQRFIIEDNIGFGEWDFEMLSEWDKSKLEDWGLEIEEKLESKKQVVEIIPYNKSHVLISYPPELHLKVNEAIELLLQESDIEIERSSN